MILCIGEILIDEIESFDNGVKTSEKHCGGAPFNVAYNAMKTGSPTAFIGAVGKDDNGRFLVEFANRYPFKNKSIQNIGKPTTIALVTNDENGERYFRFLRKDTADYQIDYDLIDRKLLSDASIIHLGSLMLSEPEGREFADKIVKFAKDNNKLLSFDVNFRSDIFPDEETAKNIYKKYIDSADILKLSEDELEMFTGTTDFDESVNRILKENVLLTVTLGSKGSFYKYNNVYAYADTIKVKPVDTTGAGDAFYGTFLGLIEKGVDFTNKEEMIKILQESNKQGAYTTTFKGAIK